MAGENLIHSGDYSARRYAEFFDGLPAPLFRTTIEGKLVYCNQALANLLGFDTAMDLIDYPVIEFYRNKKDRGPIIHTVIQTGGVFDLPVALKKKDGAPIWCAITAKAIFDDDGNAIHLDGVLKEITPDIDSDIDVPKIEGPARDLEQIIIDFDLRGALINVNSAAETFFGLPKAKLLGKSLSEFLAPGDRDLFLIFLADIFKIGRSEIILSILDGSSKVHYLKCQASLIKNNGRANHVKCITKDVTNIIKQQRRKADSQKFQGVLEMAGGVAHRLNQPLTIINNQINEILSEFKQNKRLHGKMVKIHNQIKKMNDITDKLGRIKKYEAMDYVAGIKIVDIEKSSWSHGGKEDR
ncbi:MAG: PAS domain-containing protein [Deltaproteobacteria bacterium]|nr:PAS domain-containing protein [Deltaproteobacteria bacterium]